MIRIALQLLATVIVFAAAPVRADFVDVIETKLNDGCDVEKYGQIVADFNEYYKERGYQAEILLPLHSNIGDGSVVWVGRSANASAFGVAHDHWTDELAKKGSAVSKLNERFQKCGATTSRRSYINP